MKRLALFALALLALSGCAEKPEPLADPPGGEQTQAQGDTQAQAGGQPSSAATGGGDSGIGIISPAVGGMSPVVGSDSVAGSGAGGVGNAAKDQAKRIGGQQSNGSLGNVGGDDGN